MNEENKTLIELRKETDKIESQNENLKKEFEEVKNTVGNYARRINQGIDDSIDLKKKLDDKKEETKKKSESLEKSSEENQKFKIVLKGNLFLVIAILVFTTLKFNNNLIFKKCFLWFSDRTNNIYNFVIALKKYVYYGAYNLIENKFKFSEVGSTLISLFIMILLGIIVFWAIRVANYTLLKRLISVHIKVNSFVICLIFYTPLKEYFISLNIFTIWILISFLGLLIWNSNDIVKGFKY